MAISNYFSPVPTKCLWFGWWCYFSFFGFVKDGSGAINLPASDIIAHKNRESDFSRVIDQVIHLLFNVGK